MSSPADRADHRLPSLTGLRCFAALAVFVYHAVIGPRIFLQPVFNDTTLFLFNAAGLNSISFFFVLSGFGLAWSARRREPAARFYWRRFLRIYPSHFVVCVLAIAAMLVTGATFDLHHVPEAFLLLQPWLPDVASSFGVNGVTWSLGCQAVFYLTFPLLFPLVRRIAPNRLWAWTFGIVALVCCVPLAASALFPTGPSLIWLDMPAQQYWLVYMCPLSRLLEFVLGLLLARIVQTGRFPAIRPWVAWVGLALGYLVSTFAATSTYSLVAVNVVPVLLLIGSMAERDIQGKPSVASRPAVVWLGQLSFTFYLFHRIVLENVIGAFGFTYHWTVPAAIGAIALSLAVTLLLAWNLSTAVEKPFYRRFGRSRAPVTPVPA
jgi:peptidoglycan/LPS O-acetylase OafA/YrhL